MLSSGLLAISGLTYAQQPPDVVTSDDNYNTAMGYIALLSLTTGTNNTAALYSNTTGKGNAAQGVNALYSNTTGIRNLAIGSNALYSNDGSYNIALGFDAGPRSRFWKTNSLN